MSEAQALYAEYQGLGQRAERIREYLRQVEENLEGLATVLAALRTLSETKPGTPSLAPIANGIFVETVLTETTTVRMNVGAGVVVEKSVGEARVILERQRIDLEALRENARRDLETATSRLQAIERLIEEESGEDEKGEPTKSGKNNAPRGTKPASQRQKGSRCSGS